MKNLKTRWDQELRPYLKTRMGLTSASWVVGIFLIIVVGVSIGHINQTCELAVMVFTTFILSICVLISLFARYADSERFPISAYINIGMTLFLSLSSIGLLSIDLSFTLRDKYHNDLAEVQKHQTFIAVLWNIIYWGSQLFGTFFNKFFTKFWQSGHFKTWPKNLLILIIVGSIAFGFMAFLVFGVMKIRDISGIKAVALILLNIYNMLVLVLLLAYGLFNLPIFLWKYADNKQNLYTQLERAEQTRMEYRLALADYHMIVSQCKNLINNHRTGSNSEYLDILDSELPTTDLEGATISYSTNFYLDLKPGQEVNEDFIANVRNQFKIAYFLYKRKKSKWVTLTTNINFLIVHPVNYDQEYLGKTLEHYKLEEMALKPKPNEKRAIILYRVLSILSLLFSIIVLSTEALCIIDPDFTLMNLIVVRNPQMTFLNMLFTVSFLSGVTLVCFFTIFNSQLSDFLQLVPKHTDCLQFSSITGMCCKIITVGCFNYMVIIGEAAPGKEKDPFGTSYVDFYASMLKVPFLGSYFNTIMPLFILVFGLLFAFLSIFKLKSQALSALKKVQKLGEEVTGKIKPDDDEPVLKKKGKDEKKDEIAQSELSIVERIMKGERAILLEFELEKKREERSKLTRFNDPNYYNNIPQVPQIELSSQKAQDSPQNSKIKKQTTLKSVKPDDKKQPLLDRSQSSDSSSDSESSKQQLKPQGFKKPPSYEKQNVMRQSNFSSSNTLQRQPISGAKKMSYGIFKKARIADEEYNAPDIIETAKQEEIIVSSESSEDDNKKKGIKGKFAKRVAQPKQKKRQQSSESESEEESYSDNDKRKKNKFQSKREKAVLQQRKNREQLQKKAKEGHYTKEGWLMKKKQKKIFTEWNRRYAVLKNDILTLYENEKCSIAKKTINMSQVKAVNFHYDENALVVSKKIGVKGKDESRFDVHTTQRVFMFRPEGENVWDAEDWVSVLQEAAQHFSDSYVKK